MSNNIRHHRTAVKSDADPNTSLGRIFDINWSTVRNFDSFNSELSDTLAVIFRLIFDQIGGCHKSAVFATSERIDVSETVMDCCCLEQCK